MCRASFSRHAEIASYKPFRNGKIKKFYGTLSIRFERIEQFRFSASYRRRFKFYGAAVQKTVGRRNGYSRLDNESSSIRSAKKCLPGMF